LLLDLGNLSNENHFFVETRLAVTEDPLIPYKHALMMHYIQMCIPINLKYRGCLKSNNRVQKGRRQTGKVVGIDDLLGRMRDGIHSGIG